MLRSGPMGVIGPNLVVVERVPFTWWRDTFPNGCKFCTERYTIRLHLQFVHNRHCLEMNGCIGIKFNGWNGEWKWRLDYQRVHKIVKGIIHYSLIFDSTSSLSRPTAAKLPMSLRIRHELRCLWLGNHPQAYPNCWQLISYPLVF